MGAGILSAISFGLESTWGTPVTPNKSLAIHPGDGLQTDNDVQFPLSIKAQLAKNSNSFIGKWVHSGEYEVDFIPGVAGYLIKSAMGAVASVAKGAPNASVFDHTFTETAAKPSLTIEQAVTDIVRRYAGCIVQSLKSRYLAQAAHALARRAAPPPHPQSALGRLNRLGRFLPSTPPSSSIAEHRMNILT